MQNDCKVSFDAEFDFLQVEASGFVSQLSQIKKKGNKGEKSLKREPNHLENFSYQRFQ